MLLICARASESALIPIWPALAGAANQRREPGYQPHEPGCQTRGAIVET